MANYDFVKQSMKLVKDQKVRLIKNLKSETLQMNFHKMIAHKNVQEKNFKKIT